MKKYAKYIVLVLWMAVIFFLSSQRADDSTVTTNFVIEFVYKIYSMLVSNPMNILDFTNIVFTPVRKLAHFSEFFILGVLAYIAFKHKDNIWISICVCSVYALSDEIHQIFVPGRACKLTDMLIDVCGSLLGILLIHLISKKWKKESV